MREAVNLAVLLCWNSGIAPHLSVMICVSRKVFRNYRTETSYFSLPTGRKAVFISGMPCCGQGQSKCSLMLSELTVPNGNGIRYPKSSVAYSPKGKELTAETGKMNRYVELNREARRRYAEVFPVRKDRRKGFDYE